MSFLGWGRFLDYPTEISLFNLIQDLGLEELLFIGNLLCFSLLGFFLLLQFFQFINPLIPQQCVKVSRQLTMLFLNLNLLLFFPDKAIV